MSHQGKQYAVAFRDEDLFLFLRIRRNTNGEVFVIFPRQDLNSHTSYHADGTHHHKTSGHKVMVRKRLPLTAPFQEQVNLVTTSIARGDPRAFNILCKAEQFAEVLEMPVLDIAPHTNIAVDLIGPGERPIVTLGARIIRQETFSDAVPWIMVTVYDTGSLFTTSA